MKHVTNLLILALIVPAVTMAADGPIRMHVPSGASVPKETLLTIKHEIRTKKTVRLVETAAKNLPSYVLPAQVENPFAQWQLGSVRFLIIQQRNFITHPDMEYGDEKWVGLLYSVDDGKTWQEFFELTDPKMKNYQGETVENAVNIQHVFAHRGYLYLDITDGNGAGSGEGRLTRLRSRDGGRTWQRVACLYFMPEDYYPSYRAAYEGTVWADASATTPFALKDPAECSYP